MTDAEKLVNLVRLQAAAVELFMLDESGRSSADRALARQALGQEVEDRAQELLDAVRELCGTEAPIPRKLPPPELVAPPELPTNGKLSGGAVRDVFMRLRCGMTLSELAAELDEAPAKVKPYIKAMLAGGQLREAGKLRNAPIYELVPPEGPNPPRPRRTPPEKLPPAGLDSKATGEPVRTAAMDKLTRQQRSGGGTQRMKHINRDRNHERMQEAKAERANRNRDKADRDLERLRGMRGKKK